jgi:hypothetical protein
MNTRGLPVLALAVGALLATLAYAQDFGKPGSPPANVIDLEMKIKEPFTFAGVGDLIFRQPSLALGEPRFQSLVQHLRDADISFGNLENPVIDFDTFDGQKSGAPKGALADVKLMGIRMVATANNQAMGAGEAGMFETIRNLNDANIVYAGTGRNLQEARQARFFNGPKGTVGLVSIFSMDPTTDAGNRAPATYRQGERGGKPGLNALQVTPYYIVTAEQLAALRRIRDSVYSHGNELATGKPVGIGADEGPDRIQFFGTWYKVGPKEGSVSYAMNPGDEREILRSIKNGKQVSDFMVVTIHCHQNSYSYQEYSFDHDVPDFLVDLAHKSIDNGADVFIGHGVHTIRGAEIYKGKPIFYGVSNFAYDVNRNALAPNPSTGNKTDAESGWRPERYQHETLESLLATARFEGGKLVEARLYPADLGLEYNRTLSRLGTPMTPTPEIAQRILGKVQRISKRFGTVMTIENNVGVLRPPPSGTEHTRAQLGAAQ